MTTAYFTANGTHLVDVGPLESNGVGNLSTPRQIVDVEFLDKSFVTPTDAFVINDDVSARFVQGFVFNVISGDYIGAYTVNATGFAAGAVVAQVIGGQTHIPVASIADTALPVPHAFRAGFTTPSISPTTAHNYLVTWELAGDLSTVITVGHNVQIKHFTYNGTQVKRTYVVTSVTYNPLGFTSVVTSLYDADALTPVIAITTSSVLVSPPPAGTAFGYIQYTVPTAATSIGLVGRGAAIYDANLSWGAALQTNMIHMLENFTHTVAPASPMEGQLWFDTNTYGPALQLRHGAAWYGVVAEGLPVQGNINLNNYKIANSADAVTTYPYVASLTGWGNNDQEVLNLRTADGLYIAKTGGYNTNPTVRSGTMTGSLTVSPYIEARDVTTTAIGTTGQLRVAAATNVGMSFMSNNSSVVYFDMYNATSQLTNMVYDFASSTLQLGAWYNGTSRPPVLTFNFSTGEVLTTRTSFVDNQELITKLFADTTYVNAAGDTMTGTLAMSGAANITVAAGDIILGTGTNTLSLLTNGTAASSIVFNTAGAATTTGNAVINLGNNMLTGLSNAVNTTDAVSLQFADGRYVNVTGDTMTGFLSLNADPTAALHAATKQYVDTFASGIIWLTPVYDPNLFNDTLSAPPTIDGYTKYHKTFIVAGTGTGAWTGFNGHLMAWDGTQWQSVLGRAVQVGDRFGVFCEPAETDPLTTLPAGGLLGAAGKIVTVTGVSPYTYTFYTPAEPDAFSVKGITGNAAAYQSPHMGHSYTFRGQWGTGSYGTGYSWIEFSGPQAITPGVGLVYDANTLNLATVTQGATGTSFVKVQIDNYGRVINNTPVTTADITTLVDTTYVNVAGDTMTGFLTLNATPTAALHATPKQYVDAAAGVRNTVTTTNASATIMTTDGGAATTANTYVLLDSTAYTGKAYITARDTTTGDMSSWRIEGAIKRGTGAASTAVVGTPIVTRIANDAGAAAWVVEFIADTTLGSMEIRVTGEATKTIHWAAQVSAIPVN